MVPGPGAWAQGFCLNHSSSWGELFSVGFLLHSRMQTFEVRWTYFCRPENLQPCFTSVISNLGELSNVGFLLHSWVLNFGVRRTCFCCP